MSGGWLFVFGVRLSEFVLFPVVFVGGREWSMVKGLFRVDSLCVLCALCVMEVNGQ
jgi:hypothetical protein